MFDIETMKQIEIFKIIHLLSVMLNIIYKYLQYNNDILLKEKINYFLDLKTSLKQILNLNIIHIKKLLEINDAIKYLLSEFDENDTNEKNIILFIKKEIEKIIEKIKTDNRHNYEFSFHSNKNLYMIKILKTNATIIFSEEGKLIHKSCNNIKVDYS